MEQILLDPKTQDSAEFQYKRLFHIFLISHRTKKGDLCLGSDIMELSTCFGLPGGLPRPLTFSRAPPPRHLSEAVVSPMPPLKALGASPPTM